MARTARRVGAGLLGLTLAAGLLAGASTSTADADTNTPHRVTKKNPTAYGWGGAVSSVDPDATAAGLRVLRDGGNAVDAAVATAAALGVTEPYSAGIGGGGYFVYYDARTRRVHTIDGRETAPTAMPTNAFIDPATGEPYPFAGAGDQRRVGRRARHTGHLGAGAAALGTQVAGDEPAPGHPDRRAWLRRRRDVRAARRCDNKARFAQITPTAELFLPGGDAPAVGSIFRNPDLADTYRGDGPRRSRR